ncbi:MAG: ABC transporter permease [Litorivicinaceae bacterium]
MFQLALQSLRFRALPVSLIVLSLTLGLSLILIVDRIQEGTRRGFEQTLSGVDLIIGPRSGDLQMLLYTVFHLGNPTNNVTSQSIDALSKDPTIAWTVPIALGDSHRGFRVIATDPSYFDHIRGAGGAPLRFAQGTTLSALNDVVLGATAAERLGYTLGQTLFLSHGSGPMSAAHDDYAFKVAGILAPTGTPTDQAVFIRLEGFTLLHLGWQSGTRLFSTERILATQPRLEDLRPREITAAFVGVNSRLQLFRLQRTINEYPEEALSGVLPGVALGQLWSLLGMADRAFNLLAWIILGVAVVSMMTMTITSLDARHREMSILRAVGASPQYLSGLLLAEAALIGGVASVCAMALVGLVSLWARPWLETTLGISPELAWLSAEDWLTLGGVILAGVASAVIPAILLYRSTLQHGLMERRT